MNKVTLDPVTGKIPKDFLPEYLDPLRHLNYRIDISKDRGISLLVRIHLQDPNGLGERVMQQRLSERLSLVEIISAVHEMFRSIGLSPEPQELGRKVVEAYNSDIQGKYSEELGRKVSDAYNRTVRGSYPDIPEDSLEYELRRTRMQLNTVERTNRALVDRCERLQDDLDALLHRLMELGLDV
jgi:hypothetical protein